jgi:hypothetical protein
MDPTTASLLAADRHAQFLREAAAYRAAKHARRTRPPSRRGTRFPRIRSAFDLAS